MSRVFWLQTIEERKALTREKVFNLIPIKPDKIQSSDLFKIARKQRISPNSVWKYVKQGMREGIVECIFISPKKKYYQRIKGSDLLHKLVETIKNYAMILRVIVPLLNEKQRSLLLKGLERNLKNSAELLLQITGKSPEEIRDTLKERGTLA